MSVLVQTRGLSKHFPIRRGILQRQTGEVRALDGVDLDIRRGECFALVGESGSGKTTLGRCLIRLIKPTAGSVFFDGEDLLELSGEPLRRHRRRFQMIFQDPYGSLNPRMRVKRILAEPLAVHDIVERSQRDERIAELLHTVGLPEQAMHRFPHEFSGGQRQRVGIARALATEPDFLIADEPVSALDVSVRAQIVNLLYHLQQQLGLTLLFIGHDLALVEQIADRVAVLYLGRVVEEADCSELFRRPLHPYTVSLLSAVPVADPSSRRSRIVLRGDPPSPASPPAGCPFHPRCPIAQPRCAQDVPPLVDTSDGRRVACHYPGELTVEASASP